MAIEHRDIPNFWPVFWVHNVSTMKDGDNKWIVNSGASFEYETMHVWKLVYGVQIGVLQLSSRSHMLLLRAGCPHRKRNLSIGAFFCTCMISKHELRLSFMQPPTQKSRIQVTKNESVIVLI